MRGKLEEYLNSHHIHYETIPHMRTYTAQETAAVTHTRGKEFAKTVILKVDGKMAMAVVPAQFRLDLDAFREAVGADKVELAGEQEFRDMFPECEVGAMPPFGNLYGMDVWIAKSITEDRDIAFNAGSHTELIRMPYSEYAELAHPKIMPLAA